MSAPHCPCTGSPRYQCAQHTPVQSPACSRPRGRCMVAADRLEPAQATAGGPCFFTPSSSLGPESPPPGCTSSSSWPCGQRSLRVPLPDLKTRARFWLPSVGREADGAVAALAGAGSPRPRPDAKSLAPGARVSGSHTRPHGSPSSSLCSVLRASYRPLRGRQRHSCTPAPALMLSKTHATLCKTAQLSLPQFPGRALRTRADTEP